jgi:hypothetical protein
MKFSVFIFSIAYVAITFSGGKFVLGTNATVQTQEPWKKYLIPNVKSDRLKFFNSITEETYKAAYVGKQSRFQAYLDGQRKFQWEISSNIEKIGKNVGSYKEGTIPKENLNCLRYREFPTDVKVEDVSKCQRALHHVKGTFNEIEKIKEKLNNRKRELFDADVLPKSWASSEIAFVETSLTKIDPMLKDTEKLAMDLEHVMHQLHKMFENSC